MHTLPTSATTPLLTFLLTALSTHRGDKAACCALLTALRQLEACAGPRLDLLRCGASALVATVAAGHGAVGAEGSDQEVTVCDLAGALVARLTTTKASWWRRVVALVAPAGG